MSKVHEKVSKIEAVYLQDLKPYEKNPRKHGKAIDELVKSITRHGFTNPVMIDQHNRIIAGHGRFEAAKRLNLSTVPAMRFELTESEYHELLLSDNKIGELSRWDGKMLQEVMLIMGDLEKFDVPGFEVGEIDKIFGHKHEDVSASPEAEASFGDSGTVKESSSDDRALVKSKKFLFTKQEYTFADDRLKAIKKEHGLETEVEALLFALKSFNGLTKVKTKKAEIKEVPVDA